MSGSVETPQGPGALLGAARRHQGLHIAALAAQLKVSPARLEALEAGNWEALPDPTYARALATSVCRVLGIDAGPVLAGMPRGAGAALERVTAGLNEPVKDVDGPRALSLRWGLWIAVLFVGAALAFRFWPADPGVPLSTPVELPAERQSESAAPSMPLASADPAVSAPAEPASALVSAPASALSPEPAASISPMPAAGGAGLEIRALHGASWVSVVDATGQSLVARLVSEGETLSLPDQGAPLRLVLGNAPALALSWRGQSQPLAGYEQRRVARLELK